VFEEKKNKNIENMFVKTSKDDFWKSISSYKEGENKHPLSKIEREELINELKKLFTMNNEEINNDAEKMNIVEIVNNHELICKQNISSMDKTYVNNEIIRKIIKELKNSNTRGHDGMNNNMLKMIFVNDLVIEKIKLFVNLILYTGYIPKTLNTSIIIPIIKDKSMNQFDKNNYRPISVSNVLVQILEKVILVNCPIINNSSTVQFGFKNLMSTIHPLFLLKEAIHK